MAVKEHRSLCLFQRGDKSKEKLHHSKLCLLLDFTELIRNDAEREEESSSFLKHIALFMDIYELSGTIIIVRPIFFLSHLSLVFYEVI